MLLRSTYPKFEYKINSYTLVRIFLQGLISPYKLESHSPQAKPLINRKYPSRQNTNKLFVIRKI